MKPGDLLQKDQHVWRVCGVFLGAIGQESLIEVECVSHTPGWTGEWEWHPKMFIPEVLLRNLEMKP